MNGLWANSQSNVNWLAHVYLSSPSPEFWIGNLLPDLVSATDLKSFPAKFQNGILCHREIDRFTDAHPLVRRSMARIPPPYPRYARIIVHIFYDHVLTRNWGCYSATPLVEF